MIFLRLMKTNKLSLIVRPNSSDNRIMGWQSDRLKIKLKAFPEKGKANQAVEKLLAKAIDVPRAHIAVNAGASSRRKRVSIQGMSQAALEAWLVQQPGK